MSVIPGEYNITSMQTEVSMAFDAGVKEARSQVFGLDPRAASCSCPPLLPDQFGLQQLLHTKGLGFSWWPAGLWLSPDCSPMPSPGSLLQSQASLSARNHPRLWTSEPSPRTAVSCSSILYLPCLYGDCRHTLLFPQTR